MGCVKSITLDNGKTYDVSKLTADTLGQLVRDVKPGKEDMVMRKYGIA